MITIYEKGEVVKVTHEGREWNLPIERVAIKGKDVWYHFEINPSNRFCVHATKIKCDRFTDDLIECMVDMHANATDTYWVNAGETLWERMASIYENHGGDMEALGAKFPQYFEQQDESPTKGLNMTNKLTENQAAKSVDSIDWLVSRLTDHLNECLETMNEERSFKVRGIENGKFVVEFNVTQVPEDDYVGFNGDTRERIFTDDEADYVESRVEECFNLLDDPFEYYPSLCDEEDEDED